MTVRLGFRPPLDWASTVAFLQARATLGVEVVEPGCYRRTVRVNDSSAVVDVRPGAEEPYLSLTVCPAIESGSAAVVARARRLFDLGADPRAIGAQLEQSEELSALVRARPGVRVPGAWDPFELAVRAILGQQITVRGANTLTARLVAACGEAYDGGDGLTHLFPTAAALAEADLGRIGATPARVHSIRALAAAVAGGELVLEAAEGLDEFVERMCQLPGVGPWTAQYIAMRACGEPDAFPASDLGLRRAAGNGAPLSPRELSRRAEAWRPWRAYGAMYLWGGRADSRNRM